MVELTLVFGRKPSLELVEDAEFWLVSSDPFHSASSAIVKDLDVFGSVEFSVDFVAEDVSLFSSGSADPEPL
jgi:hypothetical protein